MRNAYDQLTSRWDTVEARMHELKDRRTETSKTERRKEKTEEKQNRISQNCGATAKAITYVQGEAQKAKEKRDRRNI